VHPKLYAKEQSSQESLNRIFCLSTPGVGNSPLIYYLDLRDAVQTFRNMIDSNHATRQSFLDGYQLLVNAKRMDFNNRLRATEQNLILTEIQNL